MKPGALGSTSYKLPGLEHLGRGAASSEDALATPGRGPGLDNIKEEKKKKQATPLTKAVTSKITACGNKLTEIRLLTLELQQSKEKNLDQTTKIVLCG